MTKQEFMILAKAIKSAYTAPSFMPDESALDVWYGLLSDLPYDVAAASLKYHMQTSQRLPTPADIRSGAVRLTKKETMNAQEAWSLVSQAVRRSAYYAQDEFDKLPEPIQKAVGSASRLRQMALDEDYNEGVQQSLFEKAYQTELKRETEKQQMSPDLLKLTNDVVKRLEAQHDA